jgi:hypothetical protein
MVSTVLCLAFCIGSMSAALAQDKVKVKKTGPPDRNGVRLGKGECQFCPPGPGDGTKSVPNPALGDQDKNGDGVDDFYMGEYHFDKGTQDLTVRIWCINQAAGDGHFNDFLTYEIITSENDAQTIAVAAGIPT